jgi:hypothetical protein
MGVLTIQMNHAMSMALQSFIEDVEGIEQEVEAFAAALHDPAQDGVYVYKDGPSFVVQRSFKGVVIIEMNEDMRHLLIQFISDIEGGVDKIIWAFRLAMEDPDGCQEARNRNAYDHTKRRRVYRFNRSRDRYTEQDDSSMQPSGLE